MIYIWTARSGIASSCRFAAMCNAAGTGQCRFCPHKLRARPQEHKAEHEAEHPEPETPPAINEKPVIHPAAMVPEELGQERARKSRALAGLHEWDPNLVDQEAPQSFADICSVQITKIQARLDAAVSKEAEALARASACAAQGDMDGAVDWQLAARRFTVEKAKLTRALTCWQTMKAAGHYLSVPDDTGDTPNLTS